MEFLIWNLRFLLMGHVPLQVVTKEAVDNRSLSIEKPHAAV
jgi:hypothetical protein